MQKELKNHPYATYITQVIIAGLIIGVYAIIFNSNEVDSFSTVIFNFISVALLILSFVLMLWIIFERKMIKRWLGAVILFSLSVWVYIGCYNKIKILPGQQRFVIENKTGYTLENVKLVSVRIEKIRPILPNEAQKAVYNYYAENSSIDLACTYSNHQDTVTLVSGLTNSIGYLFKVKLRIDNGKLIADVGN